MKGTTLPPLKGLLVEPEERFKAAHDAVERLGRKVILSGIVGSTAYGLSGENSDIDTLGIYVAPINEVLGLRSDSVVDGSDVQHEPSDVTLHEVGKFMRLALQCNPTILELLFLPSYVHLHTFGAKLVEHREIFLSAPQVKARYGGYAKSQAERLIRRNEEGKEGFSADVKHRTKKHGRHCMRLLLQGAELLHTGRITVDVSEHKDFIFKIGELAAEDPEKFYRVFQDKLEAFDLIDSVLPEENNPFAANLLLIDIRKGLDS